VPDWAYLLLGLVLGAALGWLALRGTVAGLRESLDRERRLAQDKLKLLEDARRDLLVAFQALSGEALKSNNQAFLDLARTQLAQFQQGAQADLGERQKAVEELAKPIRESLEKVDEKLGELERARRDAYISLDTQIKALIDTHLPQLHRETAGLVKALRQPHARGRWGELQLRRVVELAGMLEHCDFVEQESAQTETGRQRPDMIVRLPGGKNIVVDAKTPVSAYLEAMESQEEEARSRHLTRHARQMRERMDELGRTAYWQQFEPTPEFVVMFIPGEAFFSAALQTEPDLIERGMENRVIPATPTTLIALLKSAAYGWRQEALAANAREVADLGRQLYERIGKLAEHWRRMGNHLHQAVNTYNESVGTLEARVMVSARKFAELKAAPDGHPLPDLSPVDTAPRQLSAPELCEQGRDVASPDR
jgi:DNA recombination protein RmuC